MAADQEDTGKQLAYGPMGASGKKGSGGASQLSDDDVNRIAAAIRSQMSGAAQAAEPAPTQEELSREDQAVHDALAAVHPSARNVRVTNRVDASGHLQIVEVGYSLATGSGRVTEALLVYDDGERVFVFRAA